MATVTETTILEEYTKKFANSRKKAEQARTIFPNGVTHDLRYMEPFPLYIDRAKAAQKWDIDNHLFIDYWAGHGSMLLGHSHAEIVAAVQKQMEKNTHAGGCHEGEIEWGRLVQQLIPCAEKVRFTGSGTEATLMALRLCRMYTGRPKTLKFSGHFHGWHDFVAPAADPPYDNPTVPGIPNDIVASTVTIAPNDIDLLEQTLKQDSQIGAVILEPTGGHWGAVPIRGDFLQALRDLTIKYGQVLIFDEVITGFRVAPGGAQDFYKIKPDLTTLAKILAGGLPGGCLAGKADLLDQIEIRPGKPKMRHPGTYNANPLSAAAGITILKQVATGIPTRQANDMARLLRNRLNAMFAKLDWPWIAYGDFSIFRILPDYDGPPAPEASSDNNGLIPYAGDLNKLDGPKNTKRIHTFKQGMLLNGIDMPGLGGWLTAMHTEADIDRTVLAAQKTIHRMNQEQL